MQSGGGMNIVGTDNQQALDAWRESGRSMSTDVLSAGLI
jgi:hypothetical protein